MKILFVMRHGGYVRNYDSVLRQLAADGHHIHIAVELERAKMGADRVPRALSQESPTVTVGQAPEPEDNVWTRAVRISRLIVDYARYIDPRYRNAFALRTRLRTTMPERFRPVLSLLDRCGSNVARGVCAVLCALERVVPLSTDVTSFVRAQTPDVLLVTPLVEPASIQIDYVKSARALGIPCALCVASWDNLTNKGVIRVVPDRVLLWNEAQAEEAVTLHHVPRNRVVVTGAQIFDQWFTWRPSCSREQFCAKFGFDPSRPIILYLGSSPFIAPKEAQFGLRWLSALRAAQDKDVADANVLVRPHPKNATQWGEVNLSSWPRVAVWPPAGADFLAPAFKNDFYDSLYYSGAIVGVNTSAQIEAAILGRIVCTVAAADFTHSQAGTLHFQHLVNGGLLEIAHNFDEHIAHLGGVLRGTIAQAERSRAFVESFVRPLGLEEPATPRVAAAIVETAALPIRAVRPDRFVVRALRHLLLPVAWFVGGIPDRRPWQGHRLRPSLHAVIQGWSFRSRIGHAMRRTMRRVPKLQRAGGRAARQLVINPWRKGLKRMRREVRHLAHRLRVNSRLASARVVRMLTK